MRDLPRREVERLVEEVERAVAHLQVRHQLALLGVFVSADHERPGVRCCTERVLDESFGAEVVGGEQRQCVLDVAHA